MGAFEHPFHSLMSKLIKATEGLREKWGFKVLCSLIWLQNVSIAWQAYHGCDIAAYVYLQLLQMFVNNTVREAFLKGSFYSPQKLEARDLTHSVHCWQKFSSSASCQSSLATWLAGKRWRSWWFWSEWQLRRVGWRGWRGWVSRGSKMGWLCFGGGVGGQWFGICEEQQRCSCASAPWHFPNLITDEDRLPSLYLASTFPNLHRRISADKARLGKCWHPLENS